MAESNKILTVSYGTFSCTLEGFDDAFTTMKAIAEYFRDLAADDRFFGAEPPTPDAEMLARLASQTASRRVEARQNDTGIVLRQEAATLASPAAAPNQAEPEAQAAPAPVTAPQAEAEPEEEVAVAEAPAPEAEAAPAHDPEPVAEAEPETSVAEEAAVETAETPADEPAVEDVAAEAEEPGADDESDDKDEVAEAIAEFEAIAEAEVEQQVEAPQPAAPAPRPVVTRKKATVVARRAQAAPKVQPGKPRVTVSVNRPTRLGSGPAPTEVETPAAPAAPHPDQNSVAAKLARIRGVVAKARRDDDPIGYTEDQHADAGDTTQVDADLAKVFEADADDDQTEADLDATRAAIAAELAEREGRVSEEPAVAVEDADEDDEELDISAALAIANAPHNDDDAEPDEAVFEAAEEDDGFDEESFFADEDEDDDLSAEAEEPRPVARVLKVKRRDVEAAVDDGTLEEDTVAEATIPEAIRRGESSLSPEDEAELQNELMALEQEIARGSEIEDTVEEDDEEDADPFANLMDDDGEDDEDDLSDDAWAMDDDDYEDDASDEDETWNAEADAEDDVAEEDVAEEDEDDAVAAEAAVPINPRRRLLRGADDDMDRILAETNNQLGDSDGTRRRSAIAHLRAAVAATKAEKQAGAVTEDDEQEVADVYRDDLAQVVRPRRPVVARGSGPARRAEDRPAPLKLVAEQRVDLPNPDAGPVRPRRVRMSDMAREEQAAEASVDTDAEAHARAAAANAASFNEFAERVGAVDLPDLLEAAASYLAFVEGREQFTRPQLMVKARQALEDEFSREDGLRHFGRLLREGKLRKVSAGQFAVSDRINFRPEERAVG